MHCNCLKTLQWVSFLSSEGEGGGGGSFSMICGHYKRRRRRRRDNKVSGDDPMIRQLTFLSLEVDVFLDTSSSSCFTRSSAAFVRDRTPNRTGEIR